MCYGPTGDEIMAVIRYDESSRSYHLQTGGTRHVDYERLTPDNYMKILNDQEEEVFEDFDDDCHYTRFTHIDEDEYVFLIEKLDADGESDQPDPGFYNMERSTGDFILKKRPEPNLPERYDIGGPVQSLENDIHHFFQSGEDYRSLGLTHQRAAMLYGPPGNGKTLTIMNIAQTVVEQYDGCIITSPKSFGWVERWQGLIDQPVMVVIEDITSSQESSKLLNFLDGDSSWSNTYVAATTNYPENLEEHLANRPGRIDLFINVDNPSQKQRERYLKQYYPDRYSTIANRTEGLSVAHLKELVVKHKLHDCTLDQAIQTVQSFKERFEDGFPQTDGGEVIGFTADPASNGNVPKNDLND